MERQALGAIDLVGPKPVPHALEALDPPSNVRRLPDRVCRSLQLEVHLHPDAELHLEARLLERESDGRGLRRRRHLGVLVLAVPGAGAVTRGEVDGPQRPAEFLLGRHGDDVAEAAHEDAAVHFIASKESCLDIAILRASLGLSGPHGASCTCFRGEYSLSPRVGI